MAKKIIGLGTTPNDHAGDSLRVAGGKINDNFSEIYTAIGNGTLPGLAAVAKSGDYTDLSNRPPTAPALASVPSTLSSAGTIGQISFDANYLYICVATNTWKRVALNLTTGAVDLSAVAQNIIPSIDSNGTTGFTLGTPTQKWKELFVSNGSIYIGNIKLSNVDGKLSAVKVINPGEDNEQEDPDDSDAASEIGGSADLGAFKIQGSVLGTIAEDNGWGDSSINIDPGGESYSGIYIPSVSAQQSGSSLQIYNTAEEGGPIQLSTHAGSWQFNSDGDFALPSGGTIAEGVVTNNPTIQLTPASPDVESQKLVIKGGNAFYTEENGIALGINNNVWAVGDTVTSFIYAFENAGQTLYWWIYPESAQGVIADPGFGTVTLDEQGGYGEISFELDSDDYEFTIRVSTEQNVYNQTTGVESVVLNGGAGSLDLHHLHLTTGDLQETSIFLGTDDHNVRTKINGDVEVTARDYDNEVSKRWQFTKDSELILPENTSGNFWASLNNSLDWSEGDTEYRAVAIDPDGNIYAGGRRDGYPTITKMEPNGDIVYSKVIEILGEGPINGRVNSVEYVTGEGTAILVSLEIYPNYTESVIMGLDPETGEAITDFATSFAQMDNDFYITEAVATDNTLVFVGSKNGSFVDYPVTPQTGSTTGTIIINRSALPSNTILSASDSAFQISGTGFSAAESLSNVNLYTGLTGTVRQGSGGDFIITDNGNGTYTAQTAIAGTNYRVGHKIKILGTSLGGATPDNDCVITIESITESGGIVTVSNSGTAAGTELHVYANATGTNYQVGSGLQFDLSYFSLGYADGTINNYNGGSNYVAGDVITIPGANLGGTTPTNNMIITVNTVDGSGAIGGYSIGGVAQTTTWKIDTTTQVNFGTSGDWNISISYARENFLSGFNENSVFFGLGEIDRTDRLYAVAVDGTDIYAIGESYARYEEDDFDAAVIYKFSVDSETNAFNLEWTRVLNEGSYNHEGKSVAVGSDGVYATMVAYSEGDYTSLIKLDKTTGEILWQKGTISGDDSSVAVDPDTGLIWVAAEGDYYDPVDDDAIKLMAFDSTGNIQDRRWLARTGDDLFFKNGRCLRISGDHIIVVGYSETSNSNIPFVFSVPKAEQTEGFEEGDFLFHNQGDYEVWDITNEFSYTVSPQIYEDASVLIGPVTSENISYTSFTDDRTVEDFGGVISAIVFSDGSRLETAPVQEKGIPQNNRGFNDYTLTLADNGKHIFHPGDGYRINVPAHEQLPLPIGYTVTLITKDFGTLNIEAIDYVDINNDTYYAQIVGVGLDQQSRYWSMPQRSIATLIKVEEGLWYLSGPGLTNND
jgi:hypothetical protein